MFPSSIHVLAFMLLSIWAASGQEIVRTEYGEVRGQSVDVHLNSGDFEVTSFYAIPYARAPTGNLRFEPPQKHDGWEGIFEATRLPEMCMQDPVGILIATHPLWPRYSEDCLTLTIFKPKVVAVPVLPVMVWFHGGGYVGGGSIQYPGHFLAARDVIVVVVNYRLGIFGFASTPDKQIRGNMGMLDQVMALRWVRDNIEGFGGSRNRVTIFGQSAGASSAALHVISPLSRGLFSQAIFESGTEHNLWSLNYPGQNPDSYLFQIAEKFNCSTDDITEMIACLRAVSARDLRISDELICTEGYFCQGFAPIVDGPGGFIPKHPLELREELGTASVPTLAGICSDDGSLYTIYFIPEALDGGFNQSQFQYYLRERLVSIYAPQLRDEEIVENAYRAFEWKFASFPYIDDEDENREGFNKMITDAAFGVPWDRNAKYNSQHADTYMYIFGFRTLNESAIVPAWMGVPHSGELPYVWGYGYLKTNPEIRRESLIVDLVGWTPEDAIYADYVQTLWTNFAKYGNPTPSPVPGPFDNNTIIWPHFEVEDNMKVLYMEKGFGGVYIKELHRQSDYAFFTEYMSYVTKVPIKKSQGPAPKREGFKTKQIKDVRRRFAKAVIEQHYPEEADEFLKKLEQL